jgi:hypothetical protein
VKQQRISDREQRGARCHGQRERADNGQHEAALSSQGTVREKDIVPHGITPMSSIALWKAGPERW